MNARSAERIYLVKHPEGMPTNEDLKLESIPMPRPGPGEMLLRTIYLSLDPYMRGRMSLAKSYAKGVKPGDTMVGAIADSGNVVALRGAGSEDEPGYWTGGRLRLETYRATTGRWTTELTRRYPDGGIRPGAIDVSAGRSTLGSAWGSEATLAAPLPMMVVQVVLVALALRAGRRLAVGAAALLTLACVVSFVSGFFDGQLGRDDLGGAEVAFQVWLISTTLALGVVAALNGRRRAVG